MRGRSHRPEAINTVALLPIGRISNSSSRQGGGDPRTGGPALSSRHGSTLLVQRRETRRSVEVLQQISSPFRGPSSILSSADADEHSDFLAAQGEAL